MAFKSLFPTLISQGPLAASAVVRRLNRELSADIQTLFAMDKKGQQWSKDNYVGGYTSYASLTKLHLTHAPFMELKKYIDKKMKSYVRALEVDLQGGAVEMTTCWVNVMPTLSHHSLHLHPLSFVSGTYYVDTPSGSGKLKFEDPRMGLLMASPPRKSTAPKPCQPFFSVEPKAGDLVLFESWLRHEVTANQAKYPRLSVSFNYEWR